MQIRVTVQKKECVYEQGVTFLPLFLHCSTIN